MRNSICKKIKIIILILSASISLNLNAQITNGSFENSAVGVVDSNDVQGWLLTKSDGSAAQFHIDSTQAIEGNKSLKVIVDTLGANSWSIQAIIDSIPVTNGITYNYSIWAKAEQPGAQVNFTVGNYNFAEYGAIRPADLTTEWEKFEIVFTVEDNQTFIRGPVHFNIEGNLGVAIYIDNAKIEEVKDDLPVWEGPALAEGDARFLGNNGDNPNDTYINYWNQITPGNAGKWRTIGKSADTLDWDWTALDRVYNFAKENEIPFKNHNLIWGNQQPGWISNTGLDSAQQYKYIETWIRLVGERYPDMDMIDVVNEPLFNHNPPDGRDGRANYKDALGGDGTTGWDWVIKSFELARLYMPNAELILNDYGIINNSAATTSYLTIINLLNDRGLIDAIGVQGHRFALESADLNTIKSNLDRLYSTGLPIYISEFDLGNLNNAGTPNDEQQLELYQKIFPVLWEHPGVKGITLWGYIEGQTWQSSCYLVRATGSARPALLWLADYIKNNPTSIYEFTSDNIDARFELEQNYPNPFNPTTTIQYSIDNTSKVTLKIYDVLGKEIQILVNDLQSPGKYSISFNGEGLASGIYFYQLNVGDFFSTKKLMLIK